MDRKNFFLGLFFMLLALLSLMWSAKRNHERQVQDAMNQAREEQVATAEPGSDGQNATFQASTVSGLGDTPDANTGTTQTSATENQSDLFSIAKPDIEVKPTGQETVQEQITVLRNDFIKVELSNAGAAIKQIAILGERYRAARDSHDPYIVGRYSTEKALAFSKGGGTGGYIKEFDEAFTITSYGVDYVSYRLEITPGVFLERTYKLTQTQEGAAPYIIVNENRFINGSGASIRLDNLYYSAGSAAPTDVEKSSAMLGNNMNFGYYADEDVEYIGTSKFTGSKGFIGLFKKDPVERVEEDVKVEWASVKNQFFTSILTPSRPGLGILVQAFATPQGEHDKKVPLGITGRVKFDLGVLHADSTAELDFSYYVGPKEYNKLVHLGNEQDVIMQFGWFSFFSKFMLWGLLHLENVVKNFGVAIIIMTFCIRLLIWPLTAQAAKSSKRMAAIKEPMEALREKYGDKPEVLHKEMMKLWKKNKVNPAAGCLPIFIQLPIFLAFYYMLRSAPEFRFEGFLWIKDLSLPDTIGYLGNIPLNPLPLVMGVSMYYQMKMTPTPSVDSSQQMIFKFMPFIFLFMLYNFSSGLVLYWTMSNFVSIIQQVITNRSKDPEVNGIDEAEKKTPSSGHKLRSAPPKRRKR